MHLSVTGCTSGNTKCFLFHGVVKGDDVGEEARAEVAAFGSVGFESLDAVAVNI